MAKIATYAPLGLHPFQRVRSATAGVWERCCEFAGSMSYLVSTAFAVGHAIRTEPSASTDNDAQASEFVYVAAAKLIRLRAR
jgi:hypothetical protein